MLIPDDERAAEWRSLLSRPVLRDSFQSPAVDVELDVAARSDSGKVLVSNTDHYVVMRQGRFLETLLSSLSPADLPPRYLECGYAAIVADGIGDAGAGIWASRLAISTLVQLAIRYGKWNVRISPETAAELREQGEFFYREANDAVLRARQTHEKLGAIAASLTAIYIAGTDLFFAHAGHSKAFLFRNGALVALTTDDTLEERRPIHPGPMDSTGRLIVDQQHILTEALGGRPDGPNVDIEHVQLWSGDRLLLCTNGLTDVVDDDLIADVLALRRTPTEECTRLIDLALTAGGPDNVTVIVGDYRIHAHDAAESAPASTF